MSALEIFIVYLSCGAPFGVHFYFQNRGRQRPAIVFLKSFLTVVVWIPYAVRLLNANITKKIFINNFDKKQDSDSRRLERLDEIEKRLVRIFTQAGAGLSVFEIREVVERYAGLSLALNKEENYAAAADGVGGDNDSGESESEFLIASNHQNVRLGTKCLLRRNRLRLEFHQTLARNDFLKLMSAFPPAEMKKLSPTVGEFVTLLNDAEGFEAIENLCARASQIEQDRSVTKTETAAVWKFREHKPLTEKIISAHLTPHRKPETLTATANSSSRD